MVDHGLNSQFLFIPRTEDQNMKHVNLFIFYMCHNCQHKYLILVGECMTWNMKLKRGGGGLGYGHYRFFGEYKFHFSTTLLYTFNKSTVLKKGFVLCQNRPHTYFVGQELRLQITNEHFTDVPICHHKKV